MNHLPTASGLERAFLCLSSQALPHFRSAGNQWSHRGHVIHRFLERVPQVGAEAALAEVPADLQPACACIDLERLPPFSGEAYAYEVAFAFDLETGEARELCRNTEREDAYAEARPTEVVGTCDVFGLTHDAVVLLDYKSGYRFFGPPEENPQLLFYALAAARAHGRERAHLAIIRINEHGEPFFLWGEVDGAGLDAFAARLVAVNEEIEGLKEVAQLGPQMLSPTTGDHCQYCPAVASCPAWMKLARALSHPDADVTPERPAPAELGLPDLTADTAPLYVEALRRGAKVLERIEKALQLYAEQTPIDLGGGWFYGKHPHPRDEWDAHAALPILEGYLGQQEAWSTIQATVVKKRIEAVYRAKKAAGDKGVRIGKDTTSVVEALRNMGAVTTRYTFPIGRHKADPELLEAAMNAEAALSDPEDTSGEANSG